MARFVDEICGNGLHIKWPLPWPAPPWFNDTLSGADLIVMGTNGRSGVAQLLVGSVAERVVRTARCPVLTVKHPEHEFVVPDGEPQTQTAAEV